MTLGDDSKAPFKVQLNASVKTKDEGAKESGIKPILKSSKTAGKPGILAKSKGGGLFGGSSSKP